MTEAKVHWQAPGAPWAACSASIHGHRTTREATDVTCLNCIDNGPPNYPRPSWRLLRRRRRR